MPIIQKEYLRLKTPTKVLSSNEEENRISPINSNTMILGNNTILGEENKVMTSEIVQNHNIEIFEKKEDVALNLMKKDEKQLIDEEKKLEQEKSEELMIFNLKHIKTTFLNNIQVIFFSPNINFFKFKKKKSF